MNPRRADINFFYFAAVMLYNKNVIYVYANIGTLSAD